MAETAGHRPCRFSTLRETSRKTMTTENRTILKKTLIASLALLLVMRISAFAESPADLNDLEIARVAYTADSIDI